MDSTRLKYANYRITTTAEEEEEEDAGMYHMLPMLWRVLVSTSITYAVSNRVKEVELVMVVE